MHSGILNLFEETVIFKHLHSLLMCFFYLDYFKSSLHFTSLLSLSIQIIDV